MLVVVEVHSMDAHGFRALADRCKTLARIAVRDDIREQLRQWVHDFEAEAEAADSRERSRGAALGHTAPFDRSDA
jgi:hypothetical protein